MKKLIKFFSLFILGFAAIFTLASCAKNNDETTINNTNSPVSTDVTPETSKGEVPSTTTNEVPTTTANEVPSTTTNEVPTTTTNEVPTTTTNVTPETTDDLLTVTFNTDGGKTIDPIKVEKGSKIEAPEEPIKELNDGFKYTFYGWYDENRKCIFDFEFDLVNDDVVLTAMYEKQIKKFDITFDYNLDNNYTETVTVSYGNRISKPEDPKKQGNKEYGYEFIGWFKDLSSDDAYDFSLGVNEEFTLYAKWIQIVNKYKVNFNTNGGKSIESLTVDYGSYIDYVTPTIENPAGSTYTFEYWCSDVELQNEFDFETTQIKDDITLYAKWSVEVETHKVYFIDDNGNCRETKTVDYGSYIEPLEITKEADKEYTYTLNYWCTSKDGNSDYKFDFETTPVTSDLTLYVVWRTDKVKYLLTFDTDGGSEIESQMIKWNSPIFPPNNDPTKYGYTFAGWYDGDTKFDFKTPMPCDNFTLTAKWEAVDATVTYILRNYNGNVREEDTRTVKFNGAFEDIQFDLYGFEQTAWYNENGKIYNQNAKVDEVSLTVYADVLSEGLNFILNADNYYEAYSYNGSDRNVYIPYYHFGLPVKNVRTETFKNNANITWVYLPDSVTEIEKECFYGCKQLEKIRISDNLHKLPAYAFAYSGISDLNVSTIDEIEEYCFYHCEKFKGFKDYSYSGEIASRIYFNTIPTSAFEGCKSLNSFNFKNVTLIRNSAFANCETLSELLNFDSIVEIGDYAFDKCNIESFECPDSLYIIGESAFGNNNNLTNFVIGINVLYTGARMLTNTKANFNTQNGLKYIPSKNNDYYLLYAGADVKEPTINDSCVIIGSSAFEHFSNIKTVVIPADVKTIGARAFYGCQNITTIDIKEQGFLQVIGDFAFTSTNITTLNISNSIKFIGCGILNACYNLTSVSCSRDVMWYTKINNESDPIDWKSVYGFLNLNSWVDKVNLKEESTLFFNCLTHSDVRLVFNSRMYY